ncbi:MAG: sigma-70 family RNA polymerase sigma factor [Chloroflexi bacterium]|nr:sigma-70 family RNA polymerase sigma factor [Chloroflexota bacterium]MCL5110714.1 sigma-70 family RNA polymerase sigma factor [Chloroflexota bacterium]
MEDREVAALAARAAAGDGEAFGRIYDLYLNGIYRYVYYRLGSARDAEDVTEQVFCKAWEAIGRFHPDGTPVVAWLLRIAHNAVIDHHRTRKDLAPLDEGVIDEASWADPVETATLCCTQGELREAILGLKPEQRQVILLRFIEGLDYAGVAATLGKSEGAVRVIQHRALAALRQALGMGAGKN